MRANASPDLLVRVQLVLGTGHCNLPSTVRPSIVVAIKMSCKRLPLLAVHNLFERTAIRLLDHTQWPVGRVPNGQQAGKEPVAREAEQLLRQVLVLYRGMARAEPQIGGGDGDRHGRLPEVVLEETRSARLVGTRGDDCDRRGGTGDMTRAAPHSGQSLQPRAIGDNDEVPRLPVACRGRAPAGLEDLVEVVPGDSLRGE